MQSQYKKCWNIEILWLIFSLIQKEYLKNNEINIWNINYFLFNFLWIKLFKR